MFTYLNINRIKMESDSDDDFDYPPKKKKKLDDLKKQQIIQQILDLNNELLLTNSEFEKFKTNINKINENDFNERKNELILRILNKVNISKKISDHYKNLYQCTDISDTNYKTHMMNNIKIINITRAQFDEINNMFYELPIKNKFVENVIKNNNTPLLDFENVNTNLKSIDKYTMIKTTLEKIVNPFKKQRKYNILYKIDDACYRTNKIVIHTYQFLRLFVIKDNQCIDGEFIKITCDIIAIVMKVFIKETKRGRQLSEENKKIFEYFSKLYKDEYEPLYDGIKIDGEHLSAILEYMETEILTAIENNVKMHFVEYLNRFVNCSFYEEHKKLLQNLKGEEKDELKKKLSKELKLVKNDFLNWTSTRDPKYNKWFNDHCNKILPFVSHEYKKDHLTYLKSHPQEYIVCMKRMSSAIIKMGYKSFQFFPLRTNITQKYIQMDTKSLVELLMDDGTPKNTYNSNIPKYKNKIWYSIFNMNNKIFKKSPRNDSNYQFDYRILTDGKAVSIQFIHKSYVDKNETVKKNKKNAYINAINQYKDLGRNEIETLKQERQTKNDNYKEKIIEKKYDAKQNYKKLDENEKNEVIKK